MDILRYFNSTKFQIIRKLRMTKTNLNFSAAIELGLCGRQTILGKLKPTNQRGGHRSSTSASSPISIKIGKATAKDLSIFYFLKKKMVQGIVWNSIETTSRHSSCASHASPAIPIFQRGETRGCVTDIYEYLSPGWLNGCSSLFPLVSLSLAALLKRK
jgi:hypothetical protein